MKKLSSEASLAVFLCLFTWASGRYTTCLCSCVFVPKPPKDRHWGRAHWMPQDNPTVGKVSHQLLSQGEVISWSRRRLQECSRCTEEPPRPGLGLSPAGQSPVALGVLEQWTELSGAEQEAGAARREERSHRHTGLQGSWSEGMQVSMHVCIQACVRGRWGGLQRDSGTLEPCLAKTSHSPLVSAISSLMGHLNSSGSKERKR